MTVNYVNKNVKARNINKKNLKRLEENKTKKLVMYKEPGIRIASDQKIMEHCHQNAGKKLLLI